MSSTPAVEVSASIPTYTLEIIRADRVEKKPIPWLWPGFVPMEAITTFSGLPGLGKSLATCSLIAAVTTGKPFPDGSENTTPPKEVLLLSTEDSAGSILVPRLEAAGANLSKVHIIKSTFVGAEEREVALDTDFRLIQERLRDNPDIALFVIDPVTNHCGTKNIFKDTEVRTLLRPLIQSNLATLVVAHLNKTLGLSAQQRINGAGLVGKSRAVFTFAQAANGEHHMLSSKTNYSGKLGLRYAIEMAPVKIADSLVEVPRLLWLGKSNQDADVLLDAKGQLEEKKKSSVLDSTVHWLRNFLKDGEKKATDVKEASENADISEATLRRARKELDIKPYKKGDEWIWKLPDTFVKTEGD